MVPRVPVLLDKLQRWLMPHSGLGNRSCQPLFQPDPQSIQTSCVHSNCACSMEAINFESRAPINDSSAFCRACSKRRWFSRRRCPDRPYVYYILVTLQYMYDLQACKKWSSSAACATAPRVHHVSTSTHTYTSTESPNRTPKNKRICSHSRLLVSGSPRSLPL